MGNVTITSGNNTTTFTISAATVKAMKGEDYTLEILGIPFGGPVNGRDSDKERFDAKTNVHLDKFPRVPLVLAHGLDPKTGKPSGKPEYIGVAEYLRTDERGHWFKGILDKSKNVILRLWEAAKQGLLRASSGSATHLVRVANDGTILEWPVVEMTLIDIGNSPMRPANGYAVALPMIKAIYKEAGIPFLDGASNSGDGALPYTADAVARRARVAAIKEQSNKILARANNRRI
jgi:hypothetical protein